MSKSSEEVVVDVEPRTETGKNACRRIRAQGKIPGNVYGLDGPVFMVAVSPKRLDEVLRLESGRNTLFKLRMGDSRPDAMIRELQRDPVSERMLHVDFVRVDPKKAIHVSVPIRLVGLPTGVKNEGGVLDFVHRQVQVECLPGNIPEHLDVDVSELHMNQNVTVANLGVSTGFRVLDAPESIIAVVVAPRAEEVAEPAAATAEVAAAEPEVIKKGKEAEPGAEAAKEKGSKEK